MVFDKSFAASVEWIQSRLLSPDYDQENYVFGGQLSRAAVVGLGYWGPNLVRCVEKSRHFQLSAIVDGDEHQIARVKSTLAPEVQTFTSVATLLENNIVDAILIATPASSHDVIVQMCLGHGRHIYLEKPLSLSPQTMESAVRLRRVGNVLFPGYLYFFNPLVRMMKTLLDSGTIGELTHIETVRRNYGPIRADVSPASDLMVHDLCIASILSGIGFLQVKALSTKWTQLERADAVSAFLEFKDGDLTMEARVSWLHPYKERLIILHGSNGVLLFDEMDVKTPIKVFERLSFNEYTPEIIRNFADFGRSIREAEVKLTLDQPPTDTLQIAVDTFGAAISGSRHVEYPSLEFADHIESVVNAIDRSILTGRWEHVASPTHDANFGGHIDSVR